MKLVETKCPNCSASLSIENNRKNITCKYCNAKFILDDEATVVKHINAGEISEEQEFINAETNLNVLKDYDAAYECYESLAKRYVDRKELWLGLLRSYTDDFTSTNAEESEYERYWKNYKALATNEEIKEYEEKYNEYTNNVKENVNKILEANKEHVDETIKSTNENSNALTELIITIFLGPFGVHKFMKGQIGLGILYLFTAGLFYIGWISDIIKAAKKYNETK